MNKGEWKDRSERVIIRPAVGSLTDYKENKSYEVTHEIAKMKEPDCMTDSGVNQSNRVRESI